MGVTEQRSEGHSCAPAESRRAELPEEPSSTVPWWLWQVTGLPLSPGQCNARLELGLGSPGLHSPLLSGIFLLHALPPVLVGFQG